MKIYRDSNGGTAYENPAKAGYVIPFQESRICLNIAARVARRYGSYATNRLTSGHKLILEINVK